MKPWLWFPAKWSHDMAPLVLPLVSSVCSLKQNQFHTQKWGNLHFANPIGIAGGVDKNGQNLADWQKLGAGFIEVGTITPEAQGPNPGKIMDRSMTDLALWNKMGFPNKGVSVLKKNLRKFADKKKVPLFINIGKNRSTKNESAHLDYIRCIEELHSFADVFVVNVSSPNTKDLRQLQTETYFRNFLEPIVERQKQLCPQVPVLIKLSPDMEEDQLNFTLNTSFDFVDGWILTNTTNHRRSGSPFPQEGGVSGRPLRQRSTQVLKEAMAILGERKKNKKLVSVGGVLEAEDIKERLMIGADLVQVYSALVFHGPLFFRNTLHELRALERP